jgi:hypothetical protein
MAQQSDARPVLRRRPGNAYLTSIRQRDAIRIVE